MLGNSLDCTLWAPRFQMCVNCASSKQWLKCQAFFTFFHTCLTQRTQILLKFGEKRKDIPNHTLFHYQRLTQHTDSPKSLLSIVSNKIFKNFWNSFIMSKDTSVFVCCVLKNKCYCFLLGLLDWNHGIWQFTRLSIVLLYY